MAAYRLSNQDATLLLNQAIKFLYEQHKGTADIDRELFDAPTRTPGHHFQAVWQQGRDTALIPHHDAKALERFLNRLRVLHKGEQLIQPDEMMGIVITRFGESTSTRIRATFGISRIHGENTLSIIENYAIAHRHRKRGITPLPDQQAELVYQGMTTKQSAATLDLFKSYVTDPTLPEFAADGPFRREYSVLKR